MTSRLPLVITRPEPGNAETVARARAMGLDAHAVPLFAARAMRWTLPAVEDFDALLLTSAQAARLAGEGLAALRPLPVYAVGASTARAAEDAGLRVVQTGTGGAQRLLEVIADEGLRRILWLCGRDRLRLDAPGAALTALPCYAVDPVAPPPQWDALIAAPAVVLAHSARSAAHIAMLAEQARAHLSLVAISPAVAAAAGDGWRALAVAEQPNDAAILAQAHALWHKASK